MEIETDNGMGYLEAIHGCRIQVQLESSQLQVPLLMKPRLWEILAVTQHLDTLTVNLELHTTHHLPLTQFWDIMLR